MLGNKQNVFDDFAWAAKYLERHEYGTQDRTWPSTATPTAACWWAPA